MGLDGLFKSLVWDTMVRAALSYLFAAIPWLAWGPLGAAVSFIAMHFADKLYVLLSDVVEMEYIAFKNEAHRKAFDEAAAGLQAIADAKGPDSEEFKNEREKAKAALSKFVRFAG